MTSDVSNRSWKLEKSSFRTQHFSVMDIWIKGRDGLLMRANSNRLNLSQARFPRTTNRHDGGEGKPTMKANCWYGKTVMRVEEVPDPQILNQRDAIVKISSTAICGSDLHLYNGFIPTMVKGDILGHEFMGEVVEVGKQVTNLAVGDRVVVPFPIACGTCFFCKSELFSLCENSNPNAWMAEKMFGHSPAGLFGYSHLTGGYAGGQAEYAGVPFADVGPIKVPEYLSDEQVLFLSDIFPTGYMGAEMCDITPGDTIAIWGCGPVGQFSIRSAFLLGAERVIAIDEVPERLKMAEQRGAETINYEEQNVYEADRQ